MELFHFKFVVSLLILLFLEIFLINCDAASRCLEAENSALLQLKKGFTAALLESWQPGTNCCIWEGVACDEYGRIIGLKLSVVLISGGTIDSSLFNLTSLVSLSLAQSNFHGIPIPDSGWDRLVNLSSLDLSNAEFAGSVPASISCLKKLTFLDLSSNSLAINPMILQNMTNLKELILDYVNVSSYRDEWCGVLVNSTPILELLSMRSCSLFGAICSALPMLPFLSIIRFKDNNLDSNIPDSFGNFSSLSELCLVGNNFKGFFPYQIFQLRNLKYLYISHNPTLSGYIPEFSKYNNLKTLWVFNTNFSGNLPNSIGNLKFLTNLDLSSCKFNGTIPSSFRNLSELVYLDLSYNNFNGVVGLEFIDGLKNLSTLDISKSGLSLTQLDASIGSSSSSFPKMSILKLVGCNLTKIPTFIKYQDQMTNLDLSNNRICGKIPSWLGRIVDFKQFTSLIPSNTTSQSRLSFLSLANNNLTGEIPPFICNLTELTILILSNNKLTGTIPPCLLEDGISLLVLNLRGNQLRGAIPHGISPKCVLRIIILRDNKLEGYLPRSLSNCRSLEILDLGNNNLKDKFPYWLGNLSLLRILNLRSNKFYGLIGPPDGSHETNYNFPMMHVFDISSNNFSGNLSAKCFSSFKSMITNELGGDVYKFITLNNGMFVYVITNKNKGQLKILQNYHDTFVMSIDFSNNHFEGEIPSIIGQYVYLQLLNMSQNYLTGEIPPEIGNLVQLESLDLSRNKLYGKIPQEFVSLHFLSYLNLSYNKLVGTIPQGGQLCTFTNTSFEGNEGLHWFSCFNKLVLAVNNTTPSLPSLCGTSPNNRRYMIVLGTLFGVGFGGSIATVLVLDVMFYNKAKMRSRRTSHG
ncbi:hypothetical protein KFK09_023763 [Dendrobium nobile]|uniref:Leucine-rich repeat-containing N-terminal plant-type domain-containing protein n=1 Tax=Dendrobium nobile TaxID=94219 RepID=A0A8T3ACY1_DENNO|nr:hypothetical protein KFK09_023763 [Dendrobium nobile]